MYANAYSAHAEKLKMDYPNYHFIVMLPLPPRARTQMEHLANHKHFIQMCSIITMVLMQVKLIVVPLCGTTEREPLAAKGHGRPSQWRTAICDLPRSEESTRSIRGEPLPEMRRRLGILLDHLANARNKMLRDYAAMENTESEKHTFLLHSQSFNTYFDFGFSRRANP